MPEDGSGQPTSTNSHGANGQTVALERREDTDGRLIAPSAGRNRDVVLAAFADLLPDARSVLEVASGTGEHAAWLASQLPRLVWQPSDFDPASLASIKAWASHLNATNVRDPICLDVSLPRWQDGLNEHFDAVFCSNMIHIAPVAAMHGVVSGAGDMLAEGGRFALYGPFSRNGEHTAASNAEFDRSLKSRDPDFGVRDLDLDIVPHAREAGLELEVTRNMPANNLFAVFRKQVA